MYKNFHKNKEFQEVGFPSMPADWGGVDLQSDAQGNEERSNEGEMRWRESSYSSRQSVLSGQVGYVGYGRYDIYDRYDQYDK
jgi:hypothetical protein